MTAAIASTALVAVFAWLTGGPSPFLPCRSPRRR
jgi:hypothetical protein